jgi:hypothetical protein
MQRVFQAIPERVSTNPPARSHTAIRVKLWSPAKNPGTSITGRPSPSGGSGQCSWS